MSNDTPAPAQALPPLPLADRRVLGVMVEKAKTTPDTYPMSVNGIVTGCNQKSNRDPVLSLSEEEVDQTLEELQHRGLATKILGGRVVRWKHKLYEAWDVEKVELAILAELLLRGPQTEGELRTRASRMEPIEDLDQLRAVLQPLASRGLIIHLGPEGRRGTLITHGFHLPQELEALRSQSRGEAIETTALHAAARGPSVADSGLVEVREEVAALRAQVQQLQEALGRVTQQVQNLQRALGG
jgi:uncharacterized protein YceH (UPF0502 family)